MATALSVTDFLQLIFPSDSSAGLVMSTSTPQQNPAHANPLMHLLAMLYAKLAAMEVQKALALYALLLLLLYGLKNVFSYLSAVVFARIKTGVLCDIRNAIHRSLLLQDFARWSAQEQGQWLSRMSNDVAEYEANLLDSIQMIVSATLTMAIYLLMLLYLDWRLTLLVVFVMLVGTLLLSAPRRLKRQSRQLQAINGELMTTTQETLDSLKEIKAATAIDYVNHRQQEQNKLFTRKRISLYRRIYAASPISDFLGNTIVVAILVIGASHVFSPQSAMTPALFVSYIMIYVLMLTPIKDFSNAVAQLKKGRGVEERIAASTSEKTLPAPLPQKPDGSIRSIEFCDVSFGYADHNVIEHLDFSLPMHSHTAIVGESGSGKTTFGRLLTGLLQPSEGEIRINGQPTTAPERTGRIAYIPQDPMLFNDSLEANIRFGRQWVSRNDVSQAAKMAQLEPLLSSLPQGLDTIIGDNGARLSGGERQRVNIARALVGNPDVVVMDEATAALDAATEQHLSDELKRTLGNRTMVVIAHRASTIAACHNVFHISHAHNPTKKHSPAKKLLTLLLALSFSSAAMSEIIPLNAQQVSTRVVELTWSNTTGLTSVARRYPGESQWVTIGSTASSSWTDRLHRAICDDTVYYSIVNGSDSGFAAVMVTDNDPTAPAEWGVVTVDLQSQHILLSWLPSLDTDIMGYLVCEGTPSMAIDTVFGRLNNSYTYLLGSCDEAHVFKICAFDSCRQSSALTTPCNNIVLIASIPPCTRSVTASWNLYQNMPSGVGAYELWASYDNAPYVRIAQLDNTTEDYTFNVPDNVVDMRLYTQIISTDGQYVARSNMLLHHFGESDRPSQFFLRKVSLYGDDRNVSVIGQTDPSFPVTDYTVYRSTSGGAYSAVGHCSPDNSGLLEWHDNSVNPANASYSYCFAVTDACGRNEIRTASGNILMPTIKTDNAIGTHLSWRPYSGWSGSTSYQVASAPFDADSWQCIGSTTDTFFVHSDSPDALLRYKVLAFEGGDSQYRQFDSLQSGVVSHLPHINVWMPTAFTPLENSNNTLLPRFSFPNPSGYSFSVFNRQGIMLFSSNDSSIPWNGRYKGILQPVGAYIFKITYRQNDGTEQYLLGTVTMIY